MLYFPTVLYKQGFNLTRTWVTVELTSPTGRTLAQRMWERPKRQFSGAVLGYDKAAFKAIREFFDGLAGRFNTFYWFNPKVQDFTKAPKTREFPNGVPYGAGFPLVMPWKGGTISAAYKNGVEPGGGVITTDAGGPGGETRIIHIRTFGGVDWELVSGDLLQFDVADVYERIRMRSTTDTDAFAHDWRAAIPPTETAVSFEEL